MYARSHTSLVHRLRRGLAVSAPLLLTASALKAQGVDTVRVGSPALRGVVLPTGTQVVESTLLDGGAHTSISTTTTTISRAQEEGDEVYRIHSVHTSADGDTTVGTIVVRASDLALLHHRVKAKQDSAAVASTGRHVTAWVVLPGEAVRLIDLELDHPVFPVDGPQPWLVGVLPLAEGYAAAIPRFSQWEGAEVWDQLSVVGSERVEVNGTTVECWKVDMGPLGPPGYRSMAWVDKFSGRVVQGVLSGEPGQPEYWAVTRP